MISKVPYGSGRPPRFEASGERWSPTRWTGELGKSLLDAIDRWAGFRRPGERPAHANGFVLAGTFRPTDIETDHDRLRELTDFAVVTEIPETPVVARLSNLSERLDQPDVMGLAVKFEPLSGELTDLVAMSADVFPVARAQDFPAFLTAQRSRLLRLPRLAALVITRRASARALLALHVAKGIDHGNGLATAFHGVQTFRLVRNGNGAPPASTPMRFSWVPDSANRGGPFAQWTQPVGALDSPPAFHLDLALFPTEGRLSSRERERLDDPRYRWPSDIEVIRAGTVRFTERIVERPGTLAFNPAVLAPGITPGDNDLFSGRQSSYAISASRRRRESP